MKNTSHIAATLAVAAASGLWTSATAATLKDFFIMNVCLDASGNIDKTRIPGRNSCNQRNIAGTERPYYKLRDHPSTYAFDGRCDRLRSVRELTNTVVLYNGKIRAFGYVDEGYDPNELPNCAPNADGPFRDRDRAGGDRASVRWVETQAGGIGFLMGSGDGTDLSYWNTPVCNTFPHDSRRFYDGWPLASVALPALGTTNWRFQNTRAFSYTPGSPNSDPSPVENIGDACPTYYSSFTLWSYAHFTYKSGITLPSIVTNHYSNQQSQIANPGPSKALERAYFTDEWGFSRYELWHREDYYGTDAASRQRTKDEAAKVLESGRCSKPFDLPPSPTPAMTTGAVISSGMYYEKVTNNGGTSEYWYITNCKDYTKLVFDSTEYLPSLLDLDPAYQGFWQ